MTSLIISEQQAVDVGLHLTGDREAFNVFWYRQSKSNLTLFWVEIIKTGEAVRHDPRVAVSAQIRSEA